MPERKFTWHEFFAGGGMARLGLGPKWECTFANEWSEKKASAYRSYFGACPELRVADVVKLRPDDLPGSPDLVWASFPCQDLSLAGSCAGLDGGRSGTFKPFWRLVDRMVRDGRGPKLVVLENVVGTLAPHHGDAFGTIVGALSGSGYRVGALVLDAVRFLPQSRPRLFVVGVGKGVKIPRGLVRDAPSEPWHPRPLVRAATSLSRALRDDWVWWVLPMPQDRVPSLASLIEARPTGTSWHSETETQRLLGLMSRLHRNKVTDAMRMPGRQIGTIYKRTRPNRSGEMAQRAEVRFDGVSGCLRTPVGGSSRQTIIVVESSSVRTRLISPREAARLMGLPDEYPLPNRYNEAYHISGDGVVVPVVGWLERYLLRPLAERARLQQVA